MSKRITFEGRTIIVPDDATDDEISEALSSGPTVAKAKENQKLRESGIENPALVDAGVLPKPQLNDYFRHYIGSKIPDILPAVGGTLGALGGGSGTFGLGAAAGSAAGAGLGSTIGVELQNELPSLFGDTPENVVGKIFGDVVTEGLLPEGISKGLRIAKPLAIRTGAKIFPAIKQGIAKEEGRVLSDSITSSSNVIDSAAAKMEGIKTNLYDNSITPYAKAAEDLKNTAFKDNPIADELAKFSKQGAKDVDYTKFTNKVLSDVQSVRNFKLATGGGDEVKQLALNDLLTRNYKGSDKVFDVGQILNELGGPKRQIWEEALGKTGLRDFNAFLTTAQKLPHQADNVIQYTKNRILFALPYTLGGLASGGVPGMLLGGAAGGAAHVILNNKIIAKMMENPLTAQTAKEALLTPLSSKQASFYNRVITEIIRSGNETVDVLLPSGQVKKMVMGEDGRLIEAKK